MQSSSIETKIYLSECIITRPHVSYRLLEKYVYLRTNNGDEVLKYLTSDVISETE